MIEEFVLLRNLPFNVFAPSGFSNNPPEKDEKLIKSICEYYQKRKDNGVQGKSVWDFNISRQTDFIEALKKCDVDSIYYYLSNMFTTSITQGISQGDQHFEKLKNNPDFQKGICCLTSECLLTIFQNNEIISVFSPEEYAFDKKWKTDELKTSIDSLLGKLEEKYNFDATPPRYTKELFGIILDHGHYTIRDFLSMGVALEIKNYIKRNDLHINNICEIGGGVGHLAFYLSRLGFNDITIVDLPTISVTQMFFLGTNLPENNIKFLSPLDFSGKYDLIVNVDSFVEMNKQVALDYLKKIQKGTILLSINHERITHKDEEDSFTVSKLCEQAGLKKISRDLFWLRKGYVKEYYVKT